MGAGSYSRIAYDVEASSRGLYISTRDELFSNHAINACNTAASLNNNVRQYNTQIRQEMLANLWMSIQPMIFDKLV